MSLTMHELAALRGRDRGLVTVYAIAQLIIHDRAKYQRYVAAFMPILTKHRGRLLAADEPPEVAEGPWDGDKGRAHGLPRPRDVHDLGDVARVPGDLEGPPSRGRHHWTPRTRFDVSWQRPQPCPQPRQSRAPNRSRVHVRNGLPSGFATHANLTAGARADCSSDSTTYRDRYPPDGPTPRASTMPCLAARTFPS